MNENIQFIRVISLQPNLGSNFLHGMITQKLQSLESIQQKRDHIPDLLYNPVIKMGISRQFFVLTIYELINTPNFDYAAISIS